MKSIRTLLSGAIDYAGLFPPAKLDMNTAVRSYASYHEGENAWALGRFVVPMARLEEFEHALAGAEDDTGWRISALAGASLDQDVATIAAFNKRHSSMIDTLELKSSTADEIEVAAKINPNPLIIFVEIPLGADTTSLVAAIGRQGLRAKVRTGGITSDAFPSSESLARFIHACATAGVPFKATAGLHHPLRSAYRLSYEHDSPRGTMFGFLNVFIASGVARIGGSISEVSAALEEQSPSALSVSDSELSWRQYRFGLASITALRNELAIAFGSCSFEEPIMDLKSLGFL